MKLGEINNLKVKRITDISYILSDEEDNEIFLHKKEARDDLKVGDSVAVFLYLDSKRRIAASTHEPLITVTQPAFLRVTAVDETLGYFLYDGMPKDLLLSQRDFYLPIEYAPKVGDYLFVELQVTNSSFRAKLLPKDAFYDYMHPKGYLHVNDWVKAYIVSIVPLGIVAFDLEGREFFIPRDLTRGKHRIGEELSICVIKIMSERKYQASSLKPKLDQLDEDSKKVLQYLKKNKKTNLTDKSDPIDIYQVFQLSKAAYKRAIGRLYKEKVIYITDDEITLAVE